MTCGAGVRRRRVSCQLGKEQEPLPEVRCAAEARPEDTRPCEARRCATYHWKTTPWTKASPGTPYQFLPGRVRPGRRWLPYAPP